MGKWLVVLGLLVAGAAGGAAAQPAPRAEGERRVAVTVDDLPVVPGGDCVPLCSQRITAELLRAFRLHRVPAVGFVNEGRLRRGGRLDPAGVALLRRWVEAGMELGNHTYSHADLHATPLAGFQADVLRGEQVTRRVMGAAGRRPRWFRPRTCTRGATWASAAASRRSWAGTATAWPR